MIKGTKSLNNKLNKLADVVAKENIGRATGNAMKIVQAEAKLLCPVNNGELRNSIHTMVEESPDKTVGICYTNKAYGIFVEFGTGPRGEADHAGISPAVTPVYSMAPWWIHESQIDKADAERYHWFFIDTPEGRFYQCSGQPAKPFMYPALKDNEERVTRNISNYIQRKIKEAMQQ